MKISAKNLFNKKGFTLVELLVVISILGILAAGLLAAVDPLEQLKKGRDTERRNIAIELYNASSRYYAIYGSMPASSGGTLSSTGTSAVVDALVTAGELKSTFIKGIPGGAVPIYIDMNSTAVAVCFNPESKAISRDPSTIFESSAGVAANGSCSSATNPDCFFCAR